MTEHEPSEIKNETSYNLLSGLGHWQKIDTNKHATFAILDSRFTRSMGSRFRVTAFVKACRLRGFKGHFQFVPCSTHFSFAKPQASKCFERLVIHFQTDPPCKTEVDILEEGTVPILISMQQMRNLYMGFQHTPECDYLACAAFNLKDYPTPISISNHLLLDLCNLKSSPQRVECNFPSKDLELMRTARETSPSALMLAESLVSMKGTSKLEGDSSPKVNLSEKVENLGVRLHPVFSSTADDWMYLDESPSGGSSSSSASRPQPEFH